MFGKLTEHMERLAAEERFLDRYGEPDIYTEVLLPDPIRKSASLGAFIHERKLMDEATISRIRRDLESQLASEQNADERYMLHYALHEFDRDPYTDYLKCPLCGSQDVEDEYFKSYGGTTEGYTKCGFCGYSTSYADLSAVI